MQTQSQLLSYSSYLIKCSCPNDCECSHPISIKLWHHKESGKPNRINSLGDIYCPNFKIQMNCQLYFIKNAYFKCSETNNWKQFRKATQFLMALAQALQAADFQLNDNDMYQFTTQLNISVVEKWNR